MPFKSEKQRRYMHARNPDIAKRWEKKTRETLPERIIRKRKSRKE